MSYTKTNWQNGATPAINADNLNKIEAELEFLDGVLGSLFKTVDVSMVIESKSTNGTVWSESKSFSAPDGYKPVSVVLRSHTYKAVGVSLLEGSSPAVIFTIRNDGTVSQNPYSARVYCVKISAIS